MWALLLLTGLSASAQQVNYSNLSIQPENPKQGESAEISYTPVPKLSQSKAINASIYFYQNGKYKTIDVPLKKVKNTWTGKFIASDSAEFFVVKLASGTDIDNNEKKGYSFLMAQNADSISKEAAIGLARLYRGDVYSTGVEADEKKKSFYYEKYYADGMPATTKIGEVLEYYQFKKDTTGFIDYLVALPSSEAVSDENLFYGSYYAEQFRNKPVGKLLFEVHKLKYPNGQWQQRDVYKPFNQAKTSAEKKALLDSFKATIKGEPQFWQKRVIGNINYTIANVSAREGNMTQAKEYAEIDRDGLELAGLYNSIAWQAAEAGKQLDEAAVISKKSIDIIEAEMKDLKYKSDDVSVNDYRRPMNQSFATYADTYAFILYQQGNYKEGFDYMQRAIDLVGTKSSEYNERYSLLLEKVKGPGKTLTFLEKAVVEGGYTAKMKEQFERLYASRKKKGSFETYFAGLTEKMRQQKREELKKKMLNESSPAFTLKDLDGKEVSLASLKGKVVVVDFWATWCGPCIASFPSMNLAQQKFQGKDDVVFLFVNTWEQADDKIANVKEFLKDKPYKLYVLMDQQDKMVESFKVNGIPTKFILDKAGNIRFKSVGFGGNESQAVDEIAAMVELAGASL